ncbi:DUF3108 domain-containing protein [candidate division KSB1 bacterium]|nr:DUF3108 domain-containing protein [candidate division KSB1 bacterium]
MKNLTHLLCIFLLGLLANSRADNSLINPNAAIAQQDTSTTESRADTVRADSASMVDSSGLFSDTADAKIDSALTAPIRIKPVVSKIDSLFIPVENKAFDVGEKLQFSLKYEFIKAGTAQFEVKDATAPNGRPCFRIISTAKSTRAFDWIYKVRDHIESLEDKQCMFSWQYKKQLREGGYKYDLEVKYDHRDQKAFVKAVRYHSDMSIRKKEAYTVDVPQKVRDVFGTLYFLRTQKMEVGKPIYVSNHDNRKVYNLKIIIEGKEEIEVGAGKFRCIRVQPILEGEAIFKQKGELWVWFTDDDRKIPVRLKSKAVIGAFLADLDEIKGVKGRIESRIE